MAPVEYLPSQRVAAVVIQSLMTVLPMLSVILRLYTRIVIAKTPGWDDYILATGMLLNTTHGIAVLTGLPHGAAMHQADILRIYSMDDLQYILKIAFFCTILQPWMMLSIKASLLTTYLRIFPGLIFRRVLEGLLIYFIIDAIIWSAMAIVQCKPVDRAWIWTKAGHCRNRELLYKAQALWSLFQYLVVISLPIPHLLKLQMPWKRRLLLLVIIVVGCGFTPIGTVIARVIPTLPPVVYNSDLTWWLIEMQDWIAIETGLGIICISVIFLKLLIKKMFPSLYMLLGNSFRGSSRMAARMWPGKYRGNQPHEVALRAMNPNTGVLSLPTSCYVAPDHEEPSVTNDSPRPCTYLLGSQSPDLELCQLEYPFLHRPSDGPYSYSGLCHWMIESRQVNYEQDERRRLSHKEER